MQVQHQNQLQLQQQFEIPRTDFSNLFQNSGNVSLGNSSALAIAAAKAKDLMRSKNLTESVKNANNGSSVTSNGNESSRDGKL